MNTIIKLTLCLILLNCLSACAYSHKASSFNPLKSVVEFYRGPLNHLSSVRRGECPMYPSCSQYSLQCFEKHNMFTAWMMTCDRLLRCGRDELNLSQNIFVDGKWKSYDPVEANDFWIEKGESLCPIRKLPSL